MTSDLTENVLRKMQANQDDTYTDESVMAATELLAARARIAELTEELGALRHSESLISADTEPWRTDCSTPNHVRVRNAIAELEAARARIASLLDEAKSVAQHVERVEQERDALRARLAAADIEERPLRHGDEYVRADRLPPIIETIHGHTVETYVHLERIVRIPVPRAEEKPDGDVRPEAVREIREAIAAIDRGEYYTDDEVRGYNPNVGVNVRATKAERDALLKVMQDEAQAALEAHPSFGLDDCMRGIPREIINAPPQHVTATEMGFTPPTGTIEQLEPSFGGVPLSYTKNLEDFEPGAAAPESAPAEKAETCPRWKRGDRVRHWRYGLGEVEAQTDDLAAFVRFDEHGPWPSPCHYVKPHDLAPAREPEPEKPDVMYPIGDRAHEWKPERLRPAQQYTLAQARIMLGLDGRLAAVPSQPYTGHSTLEGRIAYLERRLAQYLDDHGEVL